jgi:hypothetical protein
MLPPNDLRAGDIVYSIKDPERVGVVTCNPGEARGFATTRHDVYVSFADLGGVGGVTTITSNAKREWVKIPWEEQTALQRVVSTPYSWRPLSERSPEDVAESGPADDDTVGWHLLMALLSPGAANHLMDGSEWPDCLAIAIEVAKIIDRRSRPVQRRAA